MAGQRTRESVLLHVSLWSAVAFAVLALVWGVAVQSQMIVFDGMYSLIGVALSFVSLAAYRAIRKGADERFPFGRDALEPLVIVLKAGAIGALCVYALAGAVSDLARGGREIDTGWALAYAAVASVACLIVYLLLRPRGGAEQSSLVDAEAAEWLMDTVLSLAVLAGFAAALGLEQAGRDDLAALADPTMIAIAALVFLRLPVQLLRRGLRGLLAMAPGEETRGRVAEAVADLAHRYGFADATTRVGSFGSHLDVEVVFLVDEGTRVREVEGFDLVRRELIERLRPLSIDPTWVSVTFTADRQWAE